MKTCKHETLVKFSCEVNGEPAMLCFECTFRSDDELEIVEMTKETAPIMIGN